jgi:hypothetical protein
MITADPLPAGETLDLVEVDARHRHAEHAGVDDLGRRRQRRVELSGRGDDPPAGVARRRRQAVGQLLCVRFQEFGATAAGLPDLVFQGLALLVHSDEPAIDLPVATLVGQAADGAHQLFALRSQRRQALFDGHQRCGLRDGGENGGGADARRRRPHGLEFHFGKHAVSQAHLRPREALRVTVFFAQLSMTRPSAAATCCRSSLTSSLMAPDSISASTTLKRSISTARTARLSRSRRR